MPFLIVEALVPVKYSHVCISSLLGVLPPWPRDLLPES